MRVRRARMLVIAVVLALAGSTAVLATAAPALASQQEICAYGSDCMNAWNGGPNVYIDTPGATNEDFHWQYISGYCSSGDTVTSTCPFVVGYGINTEYEGYPIGQIVYGPTSNDRCLAATSSDNSELGYCNDPFDGEGGSYGTLFVSKNDTLVNVPITNAVTKYDGFAVVTGAQPAGGRASNVQLNGLELPTWSGL